MSLVDKVYSTGHGHCSITRVFRAWKYAMGHIQKYHNTLCLSSIIYYTYCLESLLGLTMVSKRNWKQCLCKILEGKQKCDVFFEHGPYCTQIPREKQAWNTRVKNTRKNTRENTRKLGKRVCKSLHAGCYNLREFGLIEFLHRWLSESGCTRAGGGFNLLA